MCASCVFLIFGHIHIAVHFPLSTSCEGGIAATEAKSCSSVDLKPLLIMNPYLRLVLALLFSLHHVHADISITLLNATTEEQLDLWSYTTIEFFTYRFANTNSTMLGFFHQPTPNNGCSYIEPIPDPYPVLEDGRSAIWVALIQDYPDCVDDMVKYVKNAGYRLIVTSSQNDTNNTLSSYTRNLGFPIIVIEYEYMHHYLEKALSDFDHPKILAEIETGWTSMVVVFTFGFATLLSICCLLCLFYCMCRARQRRRRWQALHDYEARNLEQQRRNYNRFQNRERVARQELIESILRQLQQLQLEGELQTPLGAERTKQLPTEKFEKSTRESVDGQSGEACAICVDDFKDGDVLRLLPCKHHFHQGCIDEWLINHSDLCPLCKKQVPNGSSRERPEQERYGRLRLGGERVGIRPREDEMLMTTEEEAEPDSPPDTNSLTDSLDLYLNRGSRYGSI